MRRTFANVLFSSFVALTLLSGGAVSETTSDDIKVVVLADGLEAKYGPLENAGRIPIIGRHLEYIKNSIQQCQHACSQIDEIKIHYVSTGTKFSDGDVVWPPADAERASPWMAVEKQTNGNVRLHVLVSDQRTIVDLWLLTTRPELSDLPLETFAFSGRCYNDALRVMESAFEVGRSVARADLPDCLPASLVAPLVSFSGGVGSGLVSLAERNSMMLRRAPSRLSPFYQAVYPALLQQMLDVPPSSDTWQDTLQHVLGIE